MIETRVRIAICGAGFSGIGAAIRLLQSDERDFVVLERADELGGVWRDNTYPGCACDVESHLYSFSFAPNPRFCRTYSTQAEIWSYLRDCAERYGVTPHLRLGHEVRSCAWDDELEAWRIETSRGVYIANVLVAAFGALSEPKLPLLPGLETFAGEVFHTARWNHGYDLVGKRVAVVGTGASATQVVPALQSRVATLTVFQRTAPWILPRHDAPIEEATRARYASSPTALALERAKIYARRELLALGFLHPTLARIGEAMARRFLAEQVPDEALRERLTPHYRLGCKRVIVSDDYLAALSCPNVVVTTAAIEARPEGLVDADGNLHAVDAIVLGTGFQATELPFAKRIHGRDGRSLDDVWAGTPRAYLGTTVSGFPNLFILLGPNTGLGHSSVLLMVEAQIELLLEAAAFLRDGGAVSVEPRAKVQAAFVDELERRMQGTVWASGGCDSWYLDRNGHNSTLWPGYTFDYKRRVERFVPEDYIVERPRGERLELTTADRAEVALGRIVGGLPGALQRILAGGSVKRDGLTLAPDLALVVRARVLLGGTSLMAESPIVARARMRRDSALHSGPAVEVCAVRDLMVDGADHPLRARLYSTSTEPAPLMVFFHGGGFVIGDLDTHDVLARRFCRDSHVHVLSIDYRLAPEHPFPAAADDAVAAYAWALSHAVELGGDGRMLVCGDSAGGNLAAVVAQANRGGPVLQVLLYPVVDRTRAWPSLGLFASGFVLSRDDIEWFDASYLGAHPSRHEDPRVTPSRTKDLSNLAPALVYTAGFDPLRDEGEAYAHQLGAAGALLELKRYDGLVHGFGSLVGVSPSSDSALGEVTQSVSRVLSTGGPS
ncbi:MAG: alpha/beta hydrolase fold domain-containing protein [Polyangia bacterium]